MAFVTNPLNFPNLTAKGTPVGADLIMIADSAAANALKQATITNIVTAGGGGGGSGALIKIASATASTSATVDFSNNLSSTYDNYEVWFYGVQNATADTSMQGRVGTGAGPTYQSTNYGGQTLSADGQSYYYFAASLTTAISLTYPSAGFPTLKATNQSLCGIMKLYNVNGSLFKKTTVHSSYLDNNNTADCLALSSGAWNVSTVLTSFRYLMASGNITVGTFTLYGVVK